MLYKFSLKTPQCVIITQRSASEPKAAGLVRLMRAILERHLADKMLDLPNFFDVHIRLDMSSLNKGKMAGLSLIAELVVCANLAFGSSIPHVFHIQMSTSLDSFQ